MAYGIGGESGFTQPLAFSIGWGLFFSTFLTLFALPAFIEIRRDFAKLFDKLQEKLASQDYSLEDLYKPWQPKPQPIEVRKPKVIRPQPKLSEKPKQPPPPPAAP